MIRSMFTVLAKVGILAVVVLVVHFLANDLKYEDVIKKWDKFAINPEAIADSPINPYEAQCERGHIKNYHPICGRGCLKVLSAPEQPIPVEPPSRAMRVNIANTKGMMKRAHFNAVYYLTKAQREFGIYGSVGEIGVFEGKFFSVMANWLDPKAGERLFICDIFGDPEHMKLKTYKPRSNMVEVNLNRLNYSFFTNDETRRIRLYNTSSLYLSKSVLLKPDMTVPAFRLFSVDGNHNYPFVLLDILTASCLIRDGGIMALDDVRNPEWPQIDVSLTEFFTHYGKDIFRPLLQVYLKMYLVTANWYGRYIEWLENNNVPERMNLIKESSEIFNVPGYYYIQYPRKGKFNKHKTILTGNNAEKRHEIIQMERK